MCDKNLAKIKQWIDLAFRNYDLCNYHVEVEGQTDKGDGYSGEIHFVKVTGFDQKGDKQTLDLAIKSSKDRHIVQNQSPVVKEAYEKEIYIYTVVKPAFQAFLKEKGIAERIDVNPYCYGSVLNDHNEVLIFENLRAQGFQLWDRTLPMTPKHVELLLQTYGQWHAFSVALKEQKPEAFKKLTENSVNMLNEVLEKLSFVPMIVREFQDSKKLAISEDEDISKQLQFSESDIKYAFNEMFFEEPEYQVILHGDCWSNNFLFKFLGDKTNPIDVRVLDWQCSGLAPPIFDLSHIIYCCADNSIHQNAKSMLEIYYKSFSEQLQRLGCEPDKVYPFDKLIEHWKRFSRFGLFFSSWVLRMSLVNANEVPDLTQNVEEQDAMERINFNFTDSVQRRFVQRVRNNILHYCNSLEM